MNKAMVKAAKVMIRAGKVILNSAACIARCCGGAAREYYLLDLCNPQGVPPGVPRTIAVLIPFMCGNCPLAAEQIVIYRSHCYKARGLSDVCSPSMKPPCLEGRCESDHFPERDIITYDILVVSGGELQCKPLTITCQDVPCVPEEPGCCSELGFTECNDPPQICQRPKRFKIVRFGNYSVKSWACENPVSYVCELVTLVFNIEGEYQCVEGSPVSVATLREARGTATLSGLTDPNTGLPSPYNGTWQVDRAAALGGENHTLSGWDMPLVKGSMQANVNLLISLMPQPFGGNANCGGSHDPGYNGPPNCIHESTSCTGGRYIFQRSGTCANGSLNTTTYRDCFTNVFSWTGTGSYALGCSGPAWEESATDQIQLVFMLACPGGGPQWPLDPIADTIIKRGRTRIGGGGVVSTGDLL